MAEAQFAREAGGRGEFVRQRNRFTHRITSGGSADYPVESGRYRLVWCAACPWSHRAMIVRGLLGLADAISLATVDPIRDEKGWRFSLDPDERDPVLGIAYLAEAYLATDPDYDGRVTVPAIIDTTTGRVVTNDFSQITLDFATEWTDYHRPGAPDLYPAGMRAELDELMTTVYSEVNNGVYRCGFASSQEAYDRGYERLFAGLDMLEERLATRRYVMGDALTEADVRLFTTLVRFDAAYHGHFKCNRNKLVEMPNLWGYARDLFQTPGFGETVDFDAIKRHYYVTHPKINPTQIVPGGPDLSGWAMPHRRA